LASIKETNICTSEVGFSAKVDMISVSEKPISLAQSIKASLRKRKDQETKINKQINEDIFRN